MRIKYLAQEFTQKTTVEIIDASMVVYRPLYKHANVYKAGKLFDIRPLEMFIGNAVKDGKEIPRFTKINDPQLVVELKKIKEEMYPSI